LSLVVDSEVKVVVVKAGRERENGREEIERKRLAELSGVKISAGELLG